MKLFVVTITKTGYVLAADETEALESVTDVYAWEPHESTAKVATGHELPWKDYALVYGAGEEITLAEARNIAGLKP